MPGGSIEVGHRVFISYGAAISSQVNVRIADDSRLGPFVVIADSDFHEVGDRNAIARPVPVTVGRGVVVGSRVTILPGSEIGDGAVIRGGSVVSGRVADGAVVGGVPARSVTEDVQAEGHDVAAVVMRVLDLSSLPDVRDGPAEIPQWDSLGALKLFLALEEAFGIDLGSDDVAAAQSVAGLAEVVKSALRRRDA
jgi:UDP-3-O-[3-hydroxymyristoyl] glucosamine N-acyltransferase/acyl carrier protein